MEAEGILAQLLEQPGPLEPSALKHVRPSGLPPLVYFCSLCDEESVARLLDAHRRTAAAGVDSGLDLDDPEPCSDFTPLHFCCELGLPGLVRDLVALGAGLQHRSADLVQPFGPPVPGGRTPLHVAAATGRADCAEELLAVGASLEALDFDGNTPARLAAAAGHGALAKRLAPSELQLSEADGSLMAKQRRDTAAAAERVGRSLEVRGLFAAVHTLPRVWQPDYCERLLQAVLQVAARRGWESSRHQAYPTTDLKCSDLPHEVDAEVRQRIDTQVFPQMLHLYGLEAQGAKLRFRDLFFVNYQARGPSLDDPEDVGPPGNRRPPGSVRPQSSLALHRDGSILSFNVLLNRPEDFDGGGTFVEPLKQTFHIGQGDVFVHSGRVLHAGAEITRGERYLLAGFIDAIGPDGSHIAG